MENQKESKLPSVGDVYLILDIKAPEVFYEVANVLTGSDELHWIHLQGKLTQDYYRIPYLYFDKSFVKLNKSTVEILFGRRKENGSETSTKPEGSK